ncbi:GDSL esterase/lipase At4g28780-like isoform X2 [Phragmites australis]|uniref:GDSL esterase/lipase At4g28780-like isoform X2 n=1 Tax=Phragmites australis TaxID=29695 RepID=UPI002D7684AF|nr:GDSL esterase/lipase At4g28780-like isoform X2 [Phragmites australis]
MAAPAAGPAMAVAGALLVLAAAVLCSPAVAGEAELSTGSSTRRQVVPAIYVFGDSLLDDGNNDFLPPAPKSVPPNGVDLPRGVARRTGRFTNGYNLADIIAQHLGFKMGPPAYLSLTSLSSLDLLRGRVGANYASGGSGILDTTGNGTITLREQVQLFVQTKARIIRAGLVCRERLDRRLGRSLFVTGTGGNDLVTFGKGGVPKSEAPEFIAGMVANYIKHINLYKLGVRRLAILDTVPVGCLPSRRATTANGECDAGVNSLSRMFNALLRVEMAKAVAESMPGLKYSIASLYNILSDMIANPTMAGLREVEIGCCGGGKFNGEVDCTAGASLCADRDEYLFWDRAHGTQAAYRRAGLAFFYGPARDADPINLDQLVREPSMAPAAYSAI